MPKTSYSLKTILPISAALRCLCGDMKDTVQGSCCISPLLFFLPFLFLTGFLPVWTDSCLSSIRCRSAWRSCTCGPLGTACKSQVIKTHRKSLFHTFGCLLYVYSFYLPISVFFFSSLNAHVRLCLALSSVITNISCFGAG